MQHQEEEEGERDPEPGNLDEEDVEEISLARKVAGRVRGRVRLRDGVVGGAAGRGVEEREEGAEDEGRGVGGQEEGFEGCGEEGLEEAGRRWFLLLLLMVYARSGCGWCVLLGCAAVSPHGR